MSRDDVELQQRRQAIIDTFDTRQVSITEFPDGLCQREDVGRAVTLQEQRASKLLLGVADCCRLIGPFALTDSAALRG